MPAILAVDQGTTNTKGLLIDTRGAIVARASRPVPIAHPRPGWAEQSPDDIWQSTAAVIADLAAAAAPGDALSIAIANQRETVVLWDAVTGRPLAPAISWQCRRASDACAALRAAGREPEVTARTGLSLDPLYPGTKIGWLLDHLPGARARAEAGELRVGTVDSWLLWRLTDGAVHATDASNAARTQLLALDAGDWAPDMLELFRIPRTLLPTVMASDAAFGRTVAGLPGIPQGVPIGAMIGDSHAALLGHGLRDRRQAKVTIGTGSSLMATTGGRALSRHGMASTIAWRASGITVHALEGNVSASGRAVAFGRDLLGLPDEAALTALASQAADSGGVTFVPALAGLGAPHWRDRARGELGGLSLATGRPQIARAILEGVALQIADMVDAVEADLGGPLESLSVDGGGSSNDFLVQLLSDVTGRPVRRPMQAEVGALGAARLAAATVAIDPSLWHQTPADEFAPRLSVEGRTALKDRWRHAVAKAGGD